MDREIALVGCGKAGLSIALALKASGWVVWGCASRSREAAEQGAQWLACPVLDSLEDLPATALILLGVPESALKEADERVASQLPSLKGRVVLHLSGGLPARVLERCRLGGASVGSFHPIMALPDPLTGAKRLRNAAFAIEGRSRAVAAMKEMASALSGKYFVLSPRGKTLYHAAAVVASNHLVALLSDSEEMLARAGADMATALPAFQSLVEGTVANVFSEGAVSALTGPVERGDTEMVKNHLQALKRWPRYRDRYRVMAQGALELARRRHPERKKAYDALAKLLSEWQSTR